MPIEGSVYAKSDVASEGRGEKCQAVRGWMRREKNVDPGRQEEQREKDIPEQAFWGDLRISGCSLSPQQLNIVGPRIRQPRGRAALQLEPRGCFCKYRRTQKHIQIWMCLHGKASVFKILVRSPRMGIISGEFYLLVGAILNRFMHFPPVIH